MGKIMIVAKREYLKMVKNKAFWFATLLIPFFMVVVIAISTASEQSLQDQLDSVVNGTKTIYVLDESGLVDQKLLEATPNISIAQDYQAGVAAVKDKQADVFIFYPADILQTNQIDIVSQDLGVFSNGLYNAFAQNLLKQNILAGINDPKKIELFNANLSINTTLYNNGVQVPAGFERFILPAVSIGIYFLFVSIASAQLLQSVSEEKENRMIEIVLSVIKPKDLILGKIIGEVSAILTQLFVLLGLALVILKLSNTSLPIDLASVQLDPLQILLAIFYLFAGLCIMAFTMVGVGAAMPSYREANSFSAVFIMLSIFPIYFFTFILAQPSGPLAIGLSYFPYTSPMILMLRNALNVLSPIETILSIIVLCIYIVIVAMITIKLFEFGAMEYSKKISFKDFFNSKLRKG
jgi:ABC-2 type transport system permease protein